MNKILVKIIIGFVLFTSLEAIAAAGGRGSVSRSSWDFGEGYDELKERMRREEESEIIKTRIGKDIVAKIDGNATTNVLKMSIFIEPEEGEIIVLSVPYVYLSGWSVRTKGIDGAKLAEHLERVLREPILGIGFIGVAFKNFAAYKADLEGLLGGAIDDDLGTEEGIRSFIHTYAHTEPSAMVSLKYILPTLRGIEDVDGKIKNIGILLVSYRPPCETCQVILNREKETKYYLSKADLSPIFKEEDIGYFIRVRSAV